MSEYICLKCNNGFDKVVEIKYREYSGASEQSDFASPCCHWHYQEAEAV